MAAADRALGGEANRPATWEHENGSRPWNESTPRPPREGSVPAGKPSPGVAGEAVRLTLSSQSRGTPRFSGSLLEQDCPCVRRRPEVGPSARVVPVIASTCPILDVLDAPITIFESPVDVASRVAQHPLAYPRQDGGDDTIGIRARKGRRAVGQAAPTRLACRCSRT